MSDDAARKAADDPRLVACIDFARRMGAHDFQLRYSDDMEPVVWMAVASIRHDGDGLPARSGKLTHHEAAAALTPADAALRLVSELGDAGHCRHCGRPSGVSDKWQYDHPLDQHVCWYIFDPETEKFRRSCEGDVPKLGRNDPCYCGSGKKFKLCHGA